MPSATVVSEVSVVSTTKEIPVGRDYTREVTEIVISRIDGSKFSANEQRQMQDALAKLIPPTPRHGRINPDSPICFVVSGGRQSCRLCYGKCLCDQNASNAVSRVITALEVAFQSEVYTMEVVS